MEREQHIEYGRFDEYMPSTTNLQTSITYRTHKEHYDRELETDECYAEYTQWTRSQVDNEISKPIFIFLSKEMPSSEILLAYWMDWVRHVYVCVCFFFS